MAFAYRFIIPAELIEADPELDFMLQNHSMYMDGPFRLVAYPIRGRKLLNVVGICPSHLFKVAGTDTPETSWMLPASKQEVIENFGKAPNGLCSPAQKLLKLADTGEGIKAWKLADRDSVLQWSKGNCTLLGDAIHPMVSFSLILFSFSYSLTWCSCIGTNPGTGRQSKHRGCRGVR